MLAHPGQLQGPPQRVMQWRSHPGDYLWVRACPLDFAQTRLRLSMIVPGRATPCRTLPSLHIRITGQYDGSITGNIHKARHMHVPRFVNWSGRLDLNQRPPEPHSGALPVCATPRIAMDYSASRRSRQLNQRIACVHAGPRQRRPPRLNCILPAPSPAQGEAAGGGLSARTLT